MPSSPRSSFFCRPTASFSISIWASRATKLPSVSSASGLISASVMSFSRKRRASLARIGVARFSCEPVTPVAAIVCFASKSGIGKRFDTWPRPTWSGWVSATSSMSIPPMSLNSISGRFAVPSQTTDA